MESKVILFTVDGGSISPNTEQKAGVQGSHNITEVRFESDVILNDAKNNPAEFKVRMQFLDGAGGFYSTGFLTVYSDETDGTLYVMCPIPNSVTNAGGVAHVYLVVTQIAYEGENAVENQVYISSPGKLVFTHSGVGSPSEYAYRKGISNALVDAEISVGLAEAHSNAAKEYKESAEGSKNDAESFAIAAETSASSAETSEANAAASAETAAEQAIEAKDYADAALGHSTDASAAKTAAETAASNASKSEESAAHSDFSANAGASVAMNYSEEAKAYRDEAAESAASSLSSAVESKGYRDEVLNNLGDMNTALDEIIALQEHYIGGEV